MRKVVMFFCYFGLESQHGQQDRNLGLETFSSNIPCATWSSTVRSLLAWAPTMTRFVDVRRMPDGGCLGLLPALAV